MDLREKVAEALENHYIDPDVTDAAGHLYCSCGEWHSNIDGPAREHRAAAVMVPVSAHVDTMAAVVEQQRQRIKELEAALERARENGGAP